MSKKMTFNYFYGNEADQYSFYRIPKLLFLNEYFKNLSSDAKILYGLMLDRMSLSIKNHWLDEENRAYIYFSIEDIMELLNCGKNKAVKTLQELDEETGIGLIEKQRQGFGKATIIYVKSFVIMEEAKEVLEETEKFTKQTIEKETDDTEVYKTNFKKFKNQTSRSPENKLQEVYISNSNYTDINYNNINNNKSNPILSDDISTHVENDQDRVDEMKAYEAIIKENIGFDSLLAIYPYNRESIEEILQLILETVLNKNKNMVIASNTYPADLVKSRFLKLKFAHIEYVLNCLKNNTSKIKNIKKYLLAALFNAPSTMDNYYCAEVKHDIANMGQISETMNDDCQKTGTYDFYGGVSK